MNEYGWYGINGIYYVYDHRTHALISSLHEHYLATSSKKEIINHVKNINKLEVKQMKEKKQLLGTAQITRFQIKVIRLRKKHTILEAAAILNITRGRVKWAQHTGLQRLRRLSYLKRIPSFILQGEIMSRKGLPPRDYSELFAALVRPSFKSRRKS